MSGQTIVERLREHFDGCEQPFGETSLTRPLLDEAADTIEELLEVARNFVRWADEPANPDSAVEVARELRAIENARAAIAKSQAPISGEGA